MASDLADVEAAVQAYAKRWGVTHHVAVHALRFIAQVGGRTTSGRRSPEHNAAVGGARNSAHLRGLAIDHVPGRGSYEDAARWLRADRCGPRCRGARFVANEHDHVHGDWLT